MWNKQKNLRIHNPGPGVVSFTTSYKWLAHKTLMLKSIFDLLGGNFVWDCIAVQIFKNIA